MYRAWAMEILEQDGVCPARYQLQACGTVGKI